MDDSSQLDELISQMMGLFQAGHHEEARAVADRLAEAGRSTAGMHPGESAALLTMSADCLDGVGREDEAGERYAEALALCEGLDAASSPASSILMRLARFHGDRGRFREALPFCERAGDLLRHADFDEAFLHHLHYLALLNEQLGNAAAAGPLYEELVELATAALGEGDPRTIAFLCDRADFLGKAGELERAETMLQRALELQRSHPDDASGRGRSAVALGVIRLQQGRADEASKLFEEALDMLRRVLPETAPVVIATLTNLGVAQTALGDYGSAESTLLGARCRYAEMVGAEAPEAVEITASLGDLYRQQGNLESAEKALLDAVAVAAATRGEDHLETTKARLNLALVYVTMDLSAKALPLFERGLAAMRSLLPAGHLLIVTGISNLGAAQLNLGDYAAAFDTLSEARELALGALGEDHPVSALVLDNLGQVHRHRGEYRQGLALAQQALAARRRILGEGHPDFAGSLSNVAKLQLELGRYSEARPLLEQALEIELQTLGSQHPRYALDLNNLANVHHQQGDSEAARRLYVEALAIMRTAFGEDHHEVASTLNNLALLESEVGDPAAAIRLARESLATERRASGEDHPRYAQSLHNLAALLAVAGRMAEAEPLARRALAIWRRALGENHPTYSSVLTQHAEILQVLGRSWEAETVWRETLEVDRRALGERHPAYAIDLAGFAHVLRELGRLAEAEEMASHAVEILRETKGEDHVGFMDALSSLGGIYLQQAKFAAAREALSRALAAGQRVLGGDHWRVGREWENLGTLFLLTGSYDEARRHFETAREVMRKHVGDAHPQFAATLRHVAEVHRLRAEYSEAQTLLEEALQIEARALGESSPACAFGLLGLAALHEETGGRGTARRLNEQALELLRAAAGGDEHPLVATALNNLGVMALRQGNLTESEGFLVRSLELRRRLLGNHHPDVAQTLGNLSLLHHERRDRAAAESTARESVEILATVLPDGHPQLAGARNNLAQLHYLSGQLADAETLQESALSGWRGALGGEHPYVALALNNLGVLRAARGRLDAAVEVMQEGERVKDLLIGRFLPGAAENRAVAWLDDVRESAAGVLSLLVHRFLDSPAVVRFAFDLVLRRKALVFDVVAQRQTATGARGVPRALVLELEEQRRLLAEQSLAHPGVEDVEAHRRLLAALEARVDALEDALARKVPAVGFGRRLRGASHSQVAAMLKPGSALVEIVRFDRVDFAALEESYRRDFDAPRQPRYLAFVVAAGDPARVSAIDLGDAGRIDVGVEAFHAWLAGAADDVDPARDGTWLRVTVFDPLRRALRGCRQLFIAPDGELQRLAFETLPEPDGGRLVDHFQVSYLVCGRDLLRAEERRRPLRRRQGERLVAAAPDYDLEDRRRRGPPVDFPEGTAFRFRPLPGARREGIEVAAALGVAPLLGPHVLKGSLQALRSPEVLHIATHGFFKSSSPRPLRDQARGLPFDEPWRAGGLALFTAPPDNPLLRSGLALAGANTALRGGPLPARAGNGLLLAADVLGLDLRGCDLVVLSACETGLGDHRAGEGVYGLRRTFLLAGASTVLCSLWPVPDLETRRLMAAFYRQIRLGSSWADALRRAQRIIRTKSAHPYYWGAFVCFGDPHGRLARRRRPQRAGRRRLPRPQLR
jgi:tetratricopeptide (TPR) repeat protein/CHAT domain-containing protein